MALPDELLDLSISVSSSVGSRLLGHRILKVEDDDLLQKRWQSLLVGHQPAPKQNRANAGGSREGRGQALCVSQLTNMEAFELNLGLQR